MVAVAVAGSTGNRLELDRALPQRVRARRWRNDGERVAFAPNAHHGLELGWVDDGAMTYRVGREVVDVAAGQVMLLPSGVEHACEFRTGMRAGSLHLDDAVLAGVVDAIGARVPAAGLLVDAGDVRALGAMLVDELARDSSDAKLCAAALVDAVVVKAVRATASSDRVDVRDVRVRRAVDLVHARFRENIDVDDIAAASGTSRFHLSRLMKSALGTSPYQLLVDVRLDEAARLLRSGRSVTDAALSSGFSDLSRFAKMFARKHGCAPRAYAASAGITARTTAARTR